MNINLIFIELLLLTTTASALENYNFSITDDLKPAKIFNQVRSSRTTRDACSVTKVLTVMEHTLEIFARVCRLEVVSSIFGLTKSIFAFAIPSTCDLDKKLDKILSKLDKIIEQIRDVSLLVLCIQKEQNYENMAQKIKSLLHLFHAFYQNRQDKARENIKSRCNDHTEGIHQIFSMFQTLLDKTKVVEFFKNCAAYQSKEVNKWADQIKQTALVIMLLVKGCEEAYNGTTQFDPTRFMKEVEEHTQYYSEIINLEEFVKDAGDKGLRNKVKSIANEAKSAEETAQTLKKMFNYFNWDVIFYSSKTEWNEQDPLSHPTNTFSGSMIFRNELNDGRNALIAWSIPNNMDSNTIKFGEQENAKDAVEWILRNNVDVNKTLNYILVHRVTKSKGDVNDCDTQIASTSGKIAHRQVTSKHKLWYGMGSKLSSFCIFTSWMTCSIEMNMPQFQIRGIIFETGEKVITRYNTKLEGHYNQSLSENDYECFQACKSDSQCVAASFYAPWPYNCLFFGEGARKSTELDWISYIKNSESIINIPEIETNNVTRLSDHYKEFILESHHKCFQECKYEEQCAIASFCASYLYNCYFFKNGFTKSTIPNWISYIKNRTDMVNMRKAEKNKCKLDTTIATDNNTRIIGVYYKRFTSESHYKCFHECISEVQCTAATFYEPLTYNCFFFKERFIQFIEPNCIPYIKNGQSKGQISVNAKWKQYGNNIAREYGNGNKLKQLSYPRGIYVHDDDQCIYIADSENNRIVEWKYNAKIGQVVAGGDKSGNRMHQLNYPSDVIVDQKNDSLIICDEENRRVVRWPRRNGRNGQIILSDIDCYGLTMDNDGNLYVSNWKKNEVKRWKIEETHGTIVAGGNGAGDQLNQLNYPTYFFVDQDHSVYVSDTKNHRVMKWMKDVKEGIVVAGGHGKGDRLRQLHRPRGVIVDNLDRVYVADTYNHRIMRWSKGSKEGQIIVGGNGKGKQLNQFKGVKGLSFDQEGNLYTVDCENDRVQKFEIDLNATNIDDKTNN